MKKKHHKRIAGGLDARRRAEWRFMLYGKIALGIAAAFQLVDGIQATMNGALRGLKDTKGPMWIALATYWGIGLTLAAVLGLGWGEIEAWGAPGVWWGLTAGLAAAAVALAIRFQARVRHGRATEYGQARVDDAVDMDP